MKTETAIETLTDLLKGGNSAEIYASGYSMFPTLRPGDKVLVNPVVENKLPIPGEIIIVNDNYTLVLHRLIEIRKNKEGEIVFITRGDSMAESDPPVRRDQIVGIAHSFRRNNKQRHLRSRIPAKRAYKFNRAILWILGRVRRMVD